VLPHLITNRLTGIDRFTGRVVWRLNGDPGWAGFVELPTVVDDIVYAASADRRVYAVHAQSGSVQWKSDGLEGSQLIAAACGSLVVTWTGVNVQLLSRSTGKYLGIIDDEIPDLSYGITSPPLTNGNELFVRSQKEYRKYICP
jgi:outer membrane protein assembly factor BamB